MTDNEINKIKVYLDIAIKLSSLSKDPNTKVASIILRSDFSLVSVGYNGFPPGFPDTEEYWNNREVKNKMVIHAEDNAIDYANGQDLTNCIIIVTHYPCPKCASKIVKKNISKVIHINDKRIDHDCELTDSIFSTKGIETFQMAV